jgi:quercetin dioxygenase-like cupin family protein
MTDRSDPVVTPRVVTSGSSSRPPRPLRPVIVDLEREARELLGEAAWLLGDRNSRTLAATDELRLTLTTLRTGAELGQAETDDALTLHVLDGRLSVTIDGADLDVLPGQVASIDHPARWRAEATEDSMILLTVALATD